MKNLNLNYDDFYKFLSSFTIFTTILSIYAAYQQIVKAYSPGLSEQEILVLVISFCFFLLSMIVSIVFFIWAMIKWKKNQDKIDEKLSAETELKIAQAKKADNEAMGINMGKLLGEK